LWFAAASFVIVVVGAGGIVGRDLKGALGAMVCGGDFHFLKAEDLGPVVAAEEGAEGVGLGGGGSSSGVCGFEECGDWSL
jgi:hypothetical protein